MGGWMGPRTSLDGEATRQIPFSIRIEPRSPSHYSVTILTELRWFFLESIIINQQCNKFYMILTDVKKMKAFRRRDVTLYSLPCVNLA
jgi:hypothetical protein